MKPTISGINYDCYRNIFLELKLESATPRTPCCMFFIYSGDLAQQHSCDAHALIENKHIDYVKDIHKVSPENYTSFMDEEKVIWNIISPLLYWEKFYWGNNESKKVWQFKLKRQGQ